MSLLEYVENVFSRSLKKKPLTRETDKISSWTILQNFNSWMIRLTKKSFGKIGVLVNFKTPNCSAFYCVSFSGERFFEGTRENIFHIFRTLLGQSQILQYCLFVLGSQQSSPSQSQYSLFVRSSQYPSPNQSGFWHTVENIVSMLIYWFS